MIEEEKVKELCESYGLGEETIREFCDALLSYPFVRDGDDEYLYECLEILASERSSQSFMEEHTPETNLRSGYLENVERCVYRIYGEEAIPYLSKAFKEVNNIETEEDEEMSL